MRIGVSAALFGLALLLSAPLARAADPIPAPAPVVVTYPYPGLYPPPPGAGLYISPSYTTGRFISPYHVLYLQGPAFEKHVLKDKLAALKKVEDSLTPPEEQAPKPKEVPDKDNPKDEKPKEKPPEVKEKPKEKPKDDEKPKEVEKKKEE
jgi:hypothetical protein